MTREAVLSPAQKPKHHADCKTQDLKAIGEGGIGKSRLFVNPPNAVPFRAIQCYTVMSV
jgi:hypothetical protein